MLCDYLRGLPLILACHLFAPFLATIVIAAEPDIYPEGPDLDELVEGIERVAELENEAAKRQERRLVILQLRAPAAEKLAFVSGELKSLREKVLENRKLVEELTKQLRVTNQQFQQAKNANDTNSMIALNGNKNQIINDMALLTTVIKDLEIKIEEWLPTWQELIRQVTEYDQELEKIKNELNAIRKQWLEVRQLPKKFARADYEKLKKATDDWLVRDGAWPEAHCWSALVSIELGEIGAAKVHIEDAEKALAEHSPEIKAWPLLEAIKGHLLVEINENKPRGLQQLHLAYLQANALMRKKRPIDAWLVYLIIGRAYSKTLSKQTQAVAIFDKATEIGGPSYAIDFARAELLVRGAQKIRDFEKAGRLLEDLWRKTGQRSWRIAYLLTLVHDNSGQQVKADNYWDEVKTLAPADRLAAIQSERNQFK